MAITDARPMKRPAGLILCLGALVLCCLFLVSKRAENNNTEKNVSESSASNRSSQDTASSDSHGVRAAKRALGNTNHASIAVEVSPELMTVEHKAADFMSGSLENMAVTDGLQMGTDPSYAPRLKPYKMFGVYVSPEQTTAAPFHALIPEIQSTQGKDSEVTFEFRSRLQNGQWTTWQEVDPKLMNTPVMTEDPSEAWQYRVTFFANDPKDAPAITSIKVAARQMPTVSQTESLTPQASPN